MELFFYFVLGFIISFLGTLTPSMLNMTAVKISINKNASEGVKFAFGVSIIVLIQAYIAILFTNYLKDNAAFLEVLQKMAIIIFIILSIYFYRLSVRNKKSSKTIKQKAGNSFLVGLLLSTLNMFAIPFYCGVTTALDVAGWFQFSEQNIILFVMGSAMGTFSLISLYAKNAKVIQEKSYGLAKNMNLVLSVLTGVLAIITLFKIL